MNPFLKKFLLAALAVFLLVPAFAQQSVGGRSQGLRLPKLREYDEGYIRRSPLAFHYAYRLSSFVNPNYAARVAAGDVKRQGGHEFGVSIHLYDPLYLDINFFQDNYSVPNDPSFSGRTVKCYGGEAFVSMDVLPYIENISSWLYPYIGIGYTMGGLEAAYKKSSDDAYGAQINSALFKGGLRIRLGGFYVSGEYKQTLPLSSGRLMSVIAIGVGMSY